MAKYDFSKYKDIPAPPSSPMIELAKPKTSWVQQRKWDIPDVFVIKVAPVGAFLMKGDNPNQKYTTKEIRNEILESLEAGACAFHTHVRDERGVHTLEIQLYHELIDSIKEKYGRNVLVCGCPEGGTTIAESLNPIVEFKGIIETAPITVTCVNLTGNFVVSMTPELVKAHVEVMQDMGCKPEIVLHNVGDISMVKRWLIDTGLLQKPYSFRLAIGNPGWAYIEDPYSMVDCVSFMMRELKKIDPECAIMVDMAGRAGLYIIALAIELGAYGARVGMEDTLWMYPHKDEKIRDNKSVVKAVATLAETLGRKPGTADDYRRFIGLM
ncbi:MAG: 3-keto-5-aminohexanoate cleavage protein [Thermodesulfobacteriota bacterium]|nr:3-keto-5-aminohexanoate cleavage protein [Thermodesulfobacteriota bacterium]